MIGVSRAVAASAASPSTCAGIVLIITSACLTRPRSAPTGTGCAPPRAPCASAPAARADDDKHPQRAEPRRHLPPDAPCSRHQRRLAHQRPLFDPHHRCQRASAVSRAFCAETFRSSPGEPPAPSAPILLSFTSPPASTARQAGIARARAHAPTRPSPKSAAPPGSSSATAA